MEMVVVVVWMSGWLDDKWLEVKMIGRNEIVEKARGATQKPYKHTPTQRSVENKTTHRGVEKKEK